MPDEPTGMPPCPSRRAALGLGVGALAAMSLSACGIRLEEGAPHLPLVPTRKPVAGEAFLIGLWRECADLTRQASALGGAPAGLPARLAVLHDDQAEVLRQELLRVGVPGTVLDTAPTGPTATGSTTTSSTGSTSTPPAATGGGLRALAAHEAAVVGAPAFRSLAHAVSAAVPLYGALLAQRGAAATLLGGTVAWPEAAWDSPSLAAGFLDSTRAAVYGFEVVAAQSPTGAQRTLARSTLAALQAREHTQESLAGSAAGPAPLAYPLPFPVTTPAAARRLAGHLVTELRAAVARQLAQVGTSDGPLGSLVQWLAQTEVLASRWGLPLEAFPGLAAAKS